MGNKLSCQRDKGYWGTVKEKFAYNKSKFCRGISEVLNANFRVSFPEKVVMWDGKWRIPLTLCT